MDKNPLHEKSVTAEQIKVGDTLALIDGQSNYYCTVRVDSIPKNESYFIGRTKSLSDGKMFERKFYYSNIGLKPFRNSKGCFWHKFNFVVMGIDVYNTGAVPIESRDYQYVGNSRHIEIVMEMGMYFAI